VPSTGACRRACAPGGRGPSTRRCAASAGACRRGRRRPRSCSAGGRTRRSSPLRLLELLEQLALLIRELLRDVDLHARDQVAAARALELRGALAPHAAQLSVGGAGRDLHRVPLRTALAARAVAGRARILDHGAVPPAPRAGLREREEALTLGDDAAAAALRADLRSGAGLRARAAARVTRDV